MYIDFDPEKHRGKKLFEVQTVEGDDTLDTVVVPSDTPFDQAAQTPWYYVVDAEDSDQ